MFAQPTQLLLWSGVFWRSQARVELTRQRTSLRNQVDREWGVKKVPLGFFLEPAAALCQDDFSLRGGAKKFPRGFFPAAQRESETGLGEALLQ